MSSFPKQQISTIYEQPLIELIDQARNIHKKYFDNSVELCKLISIKTGGCPEDCSYCSQSNTNTSDIKINPLLPLVEIEKIIVEAKKNGVKRICMGAAYKTPNSGALRRVREYIALIKKYDLESCATLGSLTQEQADELKHAGLDYYNHNIDTSPEFYPQIITTRKFQERIDTISHVGNAGIKVCCGGILGLGESHEDRISFLHALTELPFSPDSIPINTLVRIPGTKLASAPTLDKLELVRVIATTRILFPKTKIRLSAGRTELNDSEQLLCFMSGANSIHYGDKLLTTDNNHPNDDQQLLNKLGIKFNA